MRLAPRSSVRPLLPTTLALTLTVGLGAAACGEATSEEVQTSTSAGKADNGGEWSATAIELLDAEGDVGAGTAIAVDNAGHVHLTYYDATHGDLRYLRFDGDAWSAPKVLDSEGDVGAASAIALGEGGQLHVTYRERSPDNDRLKYIRFDGQSWSQPQYPTELLGTGGESAIAVDARGDVHVVTSKAIAYYRERELSTDLVYLRFDGDSWSEPVGLDEDGAHMLDKPAIEIDEAGQLHVVYADYIADSLNYLHSDGSDWGAPQPLDSADWWGDVALTSDEQGRLHVAYWAEETSWGKSEKTVRYLRFDGQWSEPAQLYKGKEAGHHVAIDAYDDELYVSYFDADAADLAVSASDGEVWIGPITLDGEGAEVGAHNSLAVDAEGALHIAYYDATHGDLKYYRQAPQ